MEGNVEGNVEGNCEVFNKGRCFGCIGLDPQYDIDKIKLQCEVYKKETKYEKG